ncbi:hypothetical protein [Arthrobacter sp. Soil763]|uniref:hypothetical protein n=1 Tax=Arthrobacter sp. Soil763 TaxID=1736402 RepID=UPI0006F9EFEA|nr:hypothetical protein [Arthrobacter sp. Soil763]KRE79811.1 hypothetical protein ASG71_07110 [Arthrobacter sp. Soil763]
MAPLGHYLSGLACRYYSRRPGRAGLGATPLAGRSGELRRQHVERCMPCQARLHRERQYLERLRGAAVPAASDDLTARLLARTGALAAEDGTATERAARPSKATEGQQSPEPRTTRGAGRPWRLAAGFAGGAAASLALVGGAAFLLGGAGPGQAPDDSFTAALPSAAFERGGLTSGSVSQAAWKLSGEPEVAPPGALGADELAALCGHGWTCPQLRELGYHLVWARGAVAGGSEVLELHLTDGTHFATVLEQRPTDGAAGRGSAGQPVNVLTGHRASEDGFVPAGPDGVPAGTGAPAADGARSPALWVNTHAPFQAIYATQAATYTYISELPAEQADDGVAALVHARPIAAGAPERDGWFAARLGRGLERILELLAR